MGSRMDIVDSQVHLGPGGAAETLAAMDALGIASVLIDEYWLRTPGHPFYPVGDGAIRTASPTAELAAWTFPGRFSYLVRVDPRDSELRNVVRFARDATYARALRISPAITRAETAAFAAGDYDNVFAAASEFGLPIFVLISGNTHLLVPYLEKYRDLKVILCHCGMPPGKRMGSAIAQMEGLPDSQDYWAKVSEEPIDQAFDKVLRMADWPNVALKWAHAPVMFDAPGYPNAGTRPYLRKALDAFGAERVMWSSDVSANMTGESWAELLFAVRDNPDLSKAERDQILGRTARAWLNWEASA
jgi:predicted TIM-barrel fold metal-dependent hydrolase